MSQDGSDKTKPVEAPAHAPHDFDRTELYNGMSAAAGKAPATGVAQDSGVAGNGRDKATHLDFAAAGDIFDSSASKQGNGTGNKSDDKAPNVRTSDTPAIKEGHFADVAKGVLTKIDTKHEGVVTKDKLAGALQDPSFKGEEAQALAAMYKNFDGLHNLSKHEHFWNSASITAGDLDKFQSVDKNGTQRLIETTGMKQWAKFNLTDFSHNGADSISRGDIDKALKNPNLEAYDRKMLELVQKNYGDIESKPNSSGLSFKDFEKLDKNAWQDDTGKLVEGVAKSSESVAQNAQKQGMSYDLYSDKDPLKSITPAGVRQGEIGDCYFEAVVASVAKSNPALIRDSIKDNNNGTYTVTFPGAKDEPITVKAPTEAELGLYNHGSKQGTWASVMEKAYGQYRENHARTSSNTPQEAADGGGLSGPVIKLLTGSDADTMKVSSLSPADMAKTLEAATVNNKTIVTATGQDGISKNNSDDKKDPTDDKLSSLHEFTITGFHPDGHGGGSVDIRNPWGLDDDTVGGTMKMPLPEYMKNFNDVSIQK